MKRSIGDAYRPGDRLTPSVTSWREIRDPGNRAFYIGSLFALALVALALSILAGHA